MKKYEYKILRSCAWPKWWKNNLTEENFNNLGRKGWDLVELDILHQVAYFKKLKQ